MDRRTFLRQAFFFAAGAGLIPRGVRSVNRRQLQLRELRRNVGIFSGRGGTIGWLADRHGITIVDAQFPTSAEIFYNELRSHHTVAVDVLINTHHHADHTAGNLFFRDIAGKIVAHENVPVLQRLTAQTRDNPDDQVYADITFTESWNMDAGDEVIHAYHHGPAHTGGDAVIRFEKANIIHMGDLVFNRWYPFIDTDGGANIENWIRLLHRTADEAEADTLFIFGHGNTDHGITGSRSDVRVMAAYLEALLEAVQKALAEDKELGEIKQLTELPGFEEYISPGARLSLEANLEAAWMELKADH